MSNSKQPQQPPGMPGPNRGFVSGGFYHQQRLVPLRKRIGANHKENRTDGAKD